MTREEAITRLKNMAWIYGSSEREQNIEAIDMAISALSADTVPREHFDTLKENYDMISKLLKEEHLKAVGKTEPSDLPISEVEVQNFHINTDQEYANVPTTPQTQNICKSESFADDLISRADAEEAIIKRLQDWVCYGNEEYRRGLYECQDIINNLPSVSAERVVRCKDCEYNENGTCFVLMCVSFDDFFCGYAKMEGGAYD